MWKYIGRKKISFFDKSINSKKLPNIIKFNKKYLENVDVVFTALPNGEAQIMSNHLKKHNILIDLAADFRLKKVQNTLNGINNHTDQKKYKEKYLCITRNFWQKSKKI